jgi:hypothetical protein
MSDRIPIKIDPDLQDLVPGFLDNRRKDVDKLKERLAAGAFEDIRLIGHSMKGVGGGYGFDAITEFGGQIERAALREDADTVRSTVERLDDFLQRVDVVVDD